MTRGRHLTRPCHEPSCVPAEHPPSRPPVGLQISGDRLRRLASVLNEVVLCDWRLSALVSDRVGGVCDYGVLVRGQLGHVPEGLVQVVGCFARVCKLDLAARAPVGPECEASSAPESSRNASVCSLPTLPARDVQESHSHTGNLHSVPASPCPAVCTGSVQRV